MLFFAIQFPKFTTRESIQEALWPDNSGPERFNRFRVALSRLRESTPLEETPNGIRLDPKQVTTDLAEVLTDLKTLSGEPDTLYELEQLKKLFPLLSRQLYFKSDMPVFEEAKTKWSVTAAEALTTLSELAFSQRDFNTAMLAAEAGLAHLPFDEQLWEQYLRSMAHLDRKREARHKFLEAVANDRDGELAALREQLPLIFESEERRFTAGQEALLLRIVERLMQSDLNWTENFFAAPAFRSEMLHNPAEAIPLLRQALALDLPPSEARERIQVRIITCLALLHRSEELVGEATRFLAEPIGSARRRIALLNLSFTLNRMGRIQEAFNAIDEATTIALTTGFIYDAWLCRGQRATMMLLNGEVLAACELLVEALAYFEANPLQGDVDAIVLLGNYGLALAVDGQWDFAADTLERAKARAIASQAESALVLISAAQGWVWAYLGRRKLALEAFHFALRAAYRSNTQQAMMVLLLAVSALRADEPVAAQRGVEEWLAVRREIVPYPLHWLELQLTGGIAQQESQHLDLTLAQAVRNALTRLRSWAESSD